MCAQLFGNTGMANIDGEKIRNLREAKGLTQLYVATVVGVTTDTISRWENRRYPNIKQENAEKLAEALEVQLAEILEDEKPEEPELSEEKTPIITPVRGSGRNWLRLIPIFLMALVLAAAWRFYGRQPEPPPISADRVMPSHVPAGEVFPVVIHVDLMAAETFPLIIKETIPTGCNPLLSAPRFTSFDVKQSILKWISRTGVEKTTFAYLVKTPTAVAGGSRLGFIGMVTLKDSGSLAAITGSNEIEVADYHWADTNRDNRIDDEEILTAYDRYAALDQLDYDWSGIDEIWSGQGYRWDSGKRRYAIIP